MTQYKPKDDTRGTWIVTIRNPEGRIRGVTVAPEDQGEPVGSDLLAWQVILHCAAAMLSGWDSSMEKMEKLKGKIVDGEET